MLPTLWKRSGQRLPSPTQLTRSSRQQQCSLPNGYAKLACCPALALALHLSALLCAAVAVSCVSALKFPLNPIYAQFHWVFTDRCKSYNLPVCAWLCKVVLPLSSNSKHLHLPAILIFEYTQVVQRHSQCIPSVNGSPVGSD